MENRQIYMLEECDFGWLQIETAIISYHTWWKEAVMYPAEET